MNSSKAVETFEGWYSLHMVYRIDFQKWHLLSAKAQQNALRGLKNYIAKLEEEHQQKKSSYAFYQINGHKGDLLLWLLQPTLDELNDLEAQFRKLPIADVLEESFSFVSVIELSNYLDQDINHPQVTARRYPALPKSKYICFYPMSKKRDLADNWFMLSMDERREMMRSHGAIGRKYAEVLKEYTTGACGLDDWEWGITLMGDDPLQFKKIVYEMRFDEVSARFGQFGSFYVGGILTEDRLNTLFDCTCSE